MRINNPVLRFVTALVMLAATVTTLVFLSFGVGSLVNAYEFPAPYVIEATGFWWTVALGFLVLFYLYAWVFVLRRVVFPIFRWLGNRLFGPKN